MSGREEWVDPLGKSLLVRSGREVEEDQSHPSTLLLHPLFLQVAPRDPPLLLLLGVPRPTTSSPADRTEERLRTPLSDRKLILNVRDVGFDFPWNLGFRVKMEVPYSSLNGVLPSREGFLRDWETFEEGEVEGWWVTFDDP